MPPTTDWVSQFNGKTVVIVAAAACWGEISGPLCAGRAAGGGAIGSSPISTAEGGGWKNHLVGH